MKTSRDQYRGVQALRGIAAFMVVLCHSSLEFGKDLESYGALRGALLSSGTFGVDLFFCISGFIIFLTTHDAHGGLNVTPVKFVKKRFLRIYPSYWLATATVLALLFCRFFTVKLDQPLTTQYLIKSLLLLPQNTRPILFPGWTLVHEVKFYALYILIVTVFARRYTLGLLLWASLCTVVLIASLMKLDFLDRNTLGRAINYVFHPASLEFISGLFLAKYFSRIAPHFASRAMLLPISLLVIAVLLGFPEFKAAQTTGTKYFAIILYGPVSLLLLATCVSLEMRSLLIVGPWLVKLGDASYSTYLIHWPLLIVTAPVLAVLHFKSLASLLVGLVVVTCFTQAMACIYYVKLDWPFYSYLQKHYY